MSFIKIPQHDMVNAAAWLWLSDHRPGPLPSTRGVAVHEWL